MKQKYMAVILMAAFLTGCAEVDVTKTGKGFYDATSASEIDILKTRPEQPFEELGTVTCTGFEASETAKMHNAIRTKAAALGATAVIITDEGFVPGAWNVPRKWATGVAIRYKTGQTQYQYK